MGLVRFWHPNMASSLCRSEQVVRSTTLNQLQESISLDFSRWLLRWLRLDTPRGSPNLTLMVRIAVMESLAIPSMTWMAGVWLWHRRYVICGLRRVRAQHCIHRGSSGEVTSLQYHLQETFDRHWRILYAMHRETHARFKECQAFACR